MINDKIAAEKIPQLASGEAWNQAFHTPHYTWQEYYQFDVSDFSQILKKILANTIHTETHYPLDKRYLLLIGTGGHAMVLSLTQKQSHAPIVWSLFDPNQTQREMVISSIDTQTASEIELMDFIEKDFLDIYNLGKHSILLAHHLAIEGVNNARLIEKKSPGEIALVEK